MCDILRRVQAALNTEETGDGLVEVARQACLAEVREAARTNHVQNIEDIDELIDILAEMPLSSDTPGVHRWPDGDGVVLAARIAKGRRKT